MLIDVRERGREGEREAEKHQCKRETSVGCLSYAPRWGTEPTIWTCVLTGNPTHHLSVCVGQRSNQLRPPARAGSSFFFFKSLFIGHL